MMIKHLVKQQVLLQQWRLLWILKVIQDQVVWLRNLLKKEYLVWKIELLLERIIANPDYYGEEKVAEAQAELPKLKAKLAEKKATTGTEEQKIEATSTPVPKGYTRSKDN